MSAPAENTIYLNANTGPDVKQIKEPFLLRWGISIILLFILLSGLLLVFIKVPQYTSAKIVVSFPDTLWLTSTARGQLTLLAAKSASVEQGDYLAFIGNDNDTTLKNLPHDKTLAFEKAAGHSRSVPSVKTLRQLNRWEQQHVIKAPAKGFLYLKHTGVSVMPGDTVLAIVPPALSVQKADIDLKGKKISTGQKARIILPADTLTRQVIFEAQVDSFFLKKNLTEIFLKVDAKALKRYRSAQPLVEGKVDICTGEQSILSMVLAQLF